MFTSPDEPELFDLCTLHDFTRRIAHTLSSRRSGGENCISSICPPPFPPSALILIYSQPSLAIILIGMQSITGIADLVAYRGARLLIPSGRQEDSGLHNLPNLPPHQEEMPVRG